MDGRWCRLLLCMCCAAAGVHGSDIQEGFGRLPATETRHYRLFTDVDADLRREVADRLDALYDEYARRLVDFPQPADAPRFNVYVFRRQEDYARFTNDRFPGTGGVFIPRSNVLAAFLEGQGRDGLRRTLQHEAFHQFAHLAIGPGLPIWLNEGLAQVFEEGAWVGRRFMPGQVPPRRLRQFEADVKARRLIPFRTLMAWDANQWRDETRQRGQGVTIYNQAWMMTHYLVYAADADGRPLHRQRLLNMLRLIHEGTAGDEAFRKAFSDNLDGFQALLLDYALALKPTREALLLERAGVLCDLLRSLHDRGKHFASADEFRAEVIRGGYRLEYRRGDVVWQTEADPALYFRDEQGREIDARALVLERGTGGAPPGLSWRVDDALIIRGRFHREGGKWDAVVEFAEPRGRDPVVVEVE